MKTDEHGKVILLVYELLKSFFTLNKICSKKGKLFKMALKLSVDELFHTNKEYSTWSYLLITFNCK